ncbi:MAG: ABC transporter ATP-binding protein [Chloroflexi bacterium]|nr:ABC transporter ATP-binding protein [Chloroflexota bacterium]
MSLIEVKQLRKVYRNGKVALENLSLRVSQGEVFGFLGPNGAGKTTAIKIMMGFVMPTSGEVRVFGLAPGDPVAKARRLISTPDRACTGVPSSRASPEVGYLPENPYFYEYLTGRELLDFYARLAGLHESQRKRRVEETLRLVGLEEAADLRLRGYSKGMQQRAGLGHALVHSPELVLLDEPTSALDPLGRREVRDLIHRLKAEGVTVFLNSHLLSEVELVCDNVAIVDRGLVIRSGSLSALVASQNELRISVDQVTAELRTRLQRIGTIQEASETEVVLAVSDVEAAALAARAVHDLGLRLYGLVPAVHRLEDIFVQAVEGGR